MQNENIDQHFIGKFNIGDEKISGELIYNKENGVTMLNLAKELDAPLGSKSYHDLDVITGKLNTGDIVTLFHNRCTKYHWCNTSEIKEQRLIYVADYSIRSDNDVTNKKYNKLECTLENAVEWSGLSVINVSPPSVIEFKNNENEKTYHWFGAKIVFSTSLECELFIIPPKEKSTVVERLVVRIEVDEKKEASYFIDVRNKIISLISFAIKDNVNIGKQYLYDYDDSYQVFEHTEFEHTEYNKYYLYTSERYLSVHDGMEEYNFWLGDLSQEKDIQKKLAKLEPIFNLYLSLFKYTDMPPEMVFLNIVQALETFHARFLQENKNSKHILLVSRLNDLLIGENNGLFSDYYVTDANFAQTVVDTRNYYTHYDEAKEKKALKGDKLSDAIKILSLLLEYSVCLQLGIDNQDNVREGLTELAWRKQFNSYSETS